MLQFKIRKIYQDIIIGAALVSMMIFTFYMVMSFWHKVCI